VAAHPATPDRRRWLAISGLLFISAVWGATFFIIKDATTDYSLMAFLVVRWFIATLALLPFCIRLRRLPRPAEWRWGVRAGIPFSLGYLFQIMALRVIDSGRVGFITGLYVVLVPVLALVFLRYRLHVRVAISGVLAVCGMILLSNAPGGSLAGDLLAFLCALSFAAQILVVEKFPKGMDWHYLAMIQAGSVVLMGAALIPLLAAAQTCQGVLCAWVTPFADALPTALPLNVLGVAAFTGLVASALGLFVQVWAQRILPPSDAALIYAMESPLAVVFGVVFLSERLTPGAFVGCALIFAAMLLVTLAGSQPAAQAQTPERFRGKIEGTIET
jgi:drug/metabolite transporter (DMT)-like permease